MKYRSVTKMREDIRYYRSLVPPLSWAAICNTLEILTKDGKPNTGLAEDIGFGTMVVDGDAVPYQPTEKEVRARMRFAPICKECHRPLRSKQHREHSRLETPGYMLWWRSLSPKERHNRIQNMFVNQIFEEAKEQAK